MLGAPSLSWRRIWSRTKARFEGADLRVCVAFWLFGMIQSNLEMCAFNTNIIQAS